MTCLHPLVSIIMPSFNQAEFIGETVKSILTQTYTKLEIVIADGASTDDTQALLRKLSQDDERINWISEPDSGPANALNKALARCRGTFVGWLNSDDLYAEEAVQRAVRHFDENPEALMVYGHGRHVDVNGQDLGPYPTLKPDAGLRGFSNGCYICQPTIFFKRSMYVLLGPLDESQKTSFDYEYWLRAFSAFPDRIGFIDAVQAYSRLHDACLTRTQRKTIALEGIQLTHKYLGAAGSQWITSYLEELRRELEAQDKADRFDPEAGQFLDQIADLYPPDLLRSMKNQLRLMNMK